MIYFKIQKNTDTVIYKYSLFVYDGHTEIDYYGDISEKKCIDWYKKNYAYNKKQNFFSYQCNKKFLKAKKLADKFKSSS